MTKAQGYSVIGVLWLILGTLTKSNWLGILQMAVGVFYIFLALLELNEN